MEDMSLDEKINEAFSYSRGETLYENKNWAHEIYDPQMLQAYIEQHQENPPLIHKLNFVRHASRLDDLEVYRETTLAFLKQGDGGLNIVGNRGVEFFRKASTLYGHELLGDMSGLGEYLQEFTLLGRGREIAELGGDEAYKLVQKRGRPLSPEVYIEALKNIYKDPKPPESLEFAKRLFGSGVSVLPPEWHDGAWRTKYPFLAEIIDETTTVFREKISHDPQLSEADKKQRLERVDKLYDSTKAMGNDSAQHVSGTMVVSMRGTIQMMAVPHSNAR
jgi:hypothetical protein